MRFPLTQLYGLNKSKPILKVEGVSGELQWDYCDLEGLPPEREPGTVSMVNHGKIPSGQYDNLPKTFTATNGAEYFIEHIHSLKNS